MSYTYQSTNSPEPTSQRESRPESGYGPTLPPQILQLADDAAAAAATTDEYRSDHEQSDNDLDPPVEEVPPPPYSAQQYGQIDLNERGMNTGARVARDGRVDINIGTRNKRLTTLLRHQLDAGPEKEDRKAEIPEGLGYTAGLPPPPMNIVIQIVGSRGDVQPFVALGQVLKRKFNHRVRIATHPVFKDFVNENGLEFFSIGGDPAELMAFMVKNPGLMPGIEAIRSGDIGKRRKGIYEMINGCWRSCIEPGDGTGPAASDDMVEGEGFDGRTSLDDPSMKPFVADAIIANPPSFAHIHVAERLGIPLHLMFTMPWSPTESFPHPLANIVTSNQDAGMTNFISYILVDLLTWQGIGDVINRFREKTLRLEPLSTIWAPGNLSRLRIPWTYCWSPALIPKPGDWMNHIDISGFYFLNLATNYTPPADLDEFLNAGPPPVYIGFGSIVVDDPNAMTKLIFEAVAKTGQRALVSKGWGGLSGDELGVPDGVFMLGNCPHDWLFKKVSCVVHHGGAGTTAAGIAAGRPTIIVPFFGDQQFWGQMCHRAGAGPEPIPNKELTADRLAEAIMYAIQPEVLERAKVMSDKIKQEKGTEVGADSFHRHLGLSKMRCSICPGRVAVWEYKKSGIRLSTLAATVLANEGLLEFSDLRLYRSQEYVPDHGPFEPISGGAAALLGTLGSMGAGVADYPTEILKSFKKNSAKAREGENGQPAPPASVATASIKSPSTTSLPKTGVPGPLTASTSSRSRSASLFSSMRSHGASSSTPAPIPEQSPNTLETPSADIASSTTTLTAGAFDYPLPPTAIFNEERVPTASGSSTPSRILENRILATPPSMNSTPTRGEESPRRGHFSLSSSRRQSREQTPKGHDRSQSFNRAQQITMDSVLGSAKATGNIVVAGIKSPLDFTMSIAQGFHNAPKLYGDKTVRPTEKVTGIESGLKAAGREFGFGMYDGISGLVTQPYQGAKEEGIIGLGKGLIKGAFGIVMKPSAAIWGLPGYAMKGVYAEIVKNFGKSTSNFIIAARTAQGYEEWKTSSAGERERIVIAWRSEIIQAKANSKWWGSKHKISEDNHRRFYDDEGQLLKGWKATRHLSYDDRKELERMRKETRRRAKSKVKEVDPPDSVPRIEKTVSIVEATDEDFEQAIRTAVQRTSNNDAEEDARIERAIRASIYAFKRKMSAESEPTSDTDDAYERLTGERAPARLSTAPQRGKTGLNFVENVEEDPEQDDEFTRALAASLEEAQRAQAHVDSRDNDTEDDEDFIKAIRNSQIPPLFGTSRQSNMTEYGSSLQDMMQTHTSNDPMHHDSFVSSFSPIDLGGDLSASSEYSQASTLNALDNVNRDSMNKEPLHSASEEDEHLQRALQASEDEAKQREKELEKTRTEEEIVLEYVKRQSLAEEEYRRKMQGVI